MRYNVVLILSFLFFDNVLTGQLSPAITSWLQNTTVKGSYYVTGSSLAVPNNTLVNCQKVEYSPTHAYIHTTGVPGYPSGPFQDGNPSQATNQSAIYKIPLSPKENTGTKTATTAGNIGVFVNGVSLFDFRDDVAWNTSTNSLCGGPGNPPCPGGMGTIQPWNRDAVLAEMKGFDCSKAHPAMGNYHHHQNPSAFKLDKKVISSICNLYDSDGLYIIDSTQHSPLLGFAYDGFPIYGPYGYANVDGTGGIKRIKSGYQLRNITVRTHHADGKDVNDGPAVSTTYPLGYFREDYEFVNHPSQSDYLDIYNGRFCVTPEYPEGIYCYYATIDENWNSSYPYAVGPTFYGVYANRKVSSVTESTTVYNPVSSIDKDFLENLTVFPSPADDYIVIQVNGLNKENIDATLYNESGLQILSTKINAGATNTYIDIRLLYEGHYFLKISTKGASVTKPIVVKH